METVNALKKCQLSRTLYRTCFAVLLAMVMLLVPPVHAQQEEALVKSAFVFNFAKFTSWPDYTGDDEDKNFTICAVGTDDVSRVLGALTGELMNKRVVRVLKYDQITGDDSCNLMYFADDPAIDVSEMLKARCCEPVLTVSTIDGFTALGGMIEMYSDDNRNIRFKINREKALASGLSLSSRLLSLGKIVTDAKQP